VAWDLTGTKGIVADLGGGPAPGGQFVMLAPDASVAATSHPDGRVEVLEIATGETFEVTVPGPHAWLSIDQIGRFVLVHVTPPEAAGSRPVRVHVIDVARRQLLSHVIELQARTGWDAVFIPDNEAILAAGDQDVSMWDVATGAERTTSRLQAADGVAGLAVHPNGRLAALSEQDRRIEVVDLSTGKLVTALEPGAEYGERLALSPLAFSADGRWLVAATWSGRVIVWDARSWRQHGTWEAVPGSAVTSLLITRDSKFLILGSPGAASIWSLDPSTSGGVTLDVDPVHPDAPVFVGTSDGGRTITTITTAGTGVRTWTVDPDRLLEHACQVAGRNLTQQEWSDVLPDRLYERTCDQYPAANKAELDGPPGRVVRVGTSVYRRCGDEAMRRSAAAAGSAVFFLVAPTMVAIVVPWLLTGWQVGGSWPAPMLAAVAGVICIAIGGVALIDSFARFVIDGLGTPAPVAPTEDLVVTGLYRWVRNPIYLALELVIVGQALLLRQSSLLVYAAIVGAAVAAFVYLYEEPTLTERYGARYVAYRAAVPRWIPRRPSRTPDAGEDPS
jgi:protein-S-isoprenylcysteine O-methyltransferase Ste14